jgi:twinkle protein
LDGDERRTIDITMTRLRSLVERTGISLFLVCHVSGDDNGKPYEEGGRIKLNKLRGSRSIGQLSDAVIALERDQQSEQGGDLATVRILKNRYSGEVGVACKLSYNLSTCQYTEVSYEAASTSSGSNDEF